jgi:hypothetical protein
MSASPSDEPDHGEEIDCAAVVDDLGEGGSAPTASGTGRLPLEDGVTVYNIPPGKVRLAKPGEIERQWQPGNS